MKTKRVIIILISILLMTSCMPVMAESGRGDRDGAGWKTIGEDTYYTDPYTGSPAVGVTEIDDAFYCFDSSGKLVINDWLELYGCKWHSDEKGIALTGLQTIDGTKYVFGSEDDYDVLDDGTEICLFGVMHDCGLYGKYVISYTGKLYKIPSASKDKKCKKIAKIIAKCSGKNAKGMTDLEKVSRAAYIVSSFYYRGTYKDKGKYYNKPYGVFYRKQSSCAGCTRALGLVLKTMGFKWKHKNENKWKHQWCIVKMDGKKGWADGQIGMAGYGTYPY